MDSSLTVVVLAAGQGTRMKSRKAKVLHRAGGKTLLDHVLDASSAIAPAADSFVVVGHQAAEVGAIAAARGVATILQDEQKGTGHALLCGRSVLEGRRGHLAILVGDCPLLSSPTLEALAARHIASGAAATVITTVLANPAGYGRIVRTGAGGRVAAIVEHRAATPEQLAIGEINSGIYCFEGTSFWRWIGEIRPDNPARELYLTDIVGLLNAAGHHVDAFCIPDSSEVLGINNRVELAAVDRVFRTRKVRELMEAGVTIEQPETVICDPGVTAAPDTVIGPFVQLLGKTAIGEGCQIGACSILNNAMVADGAVVEAFSHIADSRIGRGASVGPYARLRNGNDVGENARIGNFVELKKTRLGAGSKAPHLVYLGDAEIGAKSNIGAGTITCNYDGKQKHPTRIGDHAFVGSNSTLVAPVNVGDGSYVGAGSVITEDVPASALALGRARQVVKRDWKPKPERAETGAAPANTGEI